MNLIKIKGDASMKIVVLEGFAVNPGDLSWAALEVFGEVEVYENTEEHQIKDRLAGVQAVFVNKLKVDQTFIEENPSIEYIGELATGFDNIDLKACQEAGITVTNIPSYGSQGVAQFAFALILSLYSKVDYHADLVQRGEWSKRGSFTLHDQPIYELYGKTIGIVGYGAIGQALEKIAHGFGMEIIIYDHHADQKEAKLGDFVSLEKLIKESDIVSLHVPLTDKTKGMIGKEELETMKESAILINVSRGGIVDEEALKNALDRGEIAGAGLDVVEEEPIPDNHPLLTTGHCIITPHMAWLAKESRQRLLDMALENFKAYLEGHPQNQLTEL